MFSCKLRNASTFVVFKFIQGTTNFTKSQVGDKKREETLWQGEKKTKMKRKK